MKASYLMNLKYVSIIKIEMTLGLTLYMSWINGLMFKKQFNPESEKHSTNQIG